MYKMAVGGGWLAVGRGGSSPPPPPSKKKNIPKSSTILQPPNKMMSILGTHLIAEFLTDSKGHFKDELENCVCKTQVMPPCPKPVLTPCLTLNTFNQYWRLMSEMSKSKLQ